MPELESWIRLAKLESPKKAVALVDHFGGPDEVFRAKPAQFAYVEGMNPKTAERVRAAASEPVDAELEALERIGARVVTIRDPEYPASLRQIYDPPPVLFVRGEIREEDRFAVGVVGTRRPSEHGRMIAREISRDLAAQGICIVSGGAYGIDTEAHAGAVETGRTICVLGCGVDIAYPPHNAELFEKIAASGALVSEFVPGTQPDYWRFPVRNRLISGLSLGVLIVESRSKGGAMITATLAAEQGRDVWAVPGMTRSSTSEGPHTLIREGAKLVERAEDILMDLGVQIESKPYKRTEIPENLSPEQKSVIRALDLHPKHVDEIIAECGLTPAAASTALTLLEMQGLIRRVPGNAYVRSV